MNIGIDCIALPGKFSGAAYYIINLTRTLLKSHRPFNIQVYCKKNHAALFSRYLKGKDMIITVNLRNRFHQILYYEKFLSAKIIRNNTNIFIATHYITPPKNDHYKILTVFHDLGFIVHPEYYPVLKRIYFQKRIPAFINRSEKVITVSQNTRRELIDNFPQAESKTLCIYPGINHLQNFKTIFMNGATEEKPFILAVNSMEKRKNIPLAFKIFDKLISVYNLEHNLILVTPHKIYPKNIMHLKNRSPYKKRVIFLNNIGAGALKGLYKKASFFLNTSGYEGFGFTPTEAVSMGCPSFLYPNNVIKEIFGGHPYIIDSQKAEVWAEKINRELSKEFPNRLPRKILRNLSWNKCAANFINTIEQF